MDEPGTKPNSGRGSATDARMQRAEELFHAARELAARERAPYLREACAGDERMQRFVERLLDLAERDNALDRRVLDIGEPESADVGLLPERIGRYRILGLLGEGGMGCVYEALQDDPRRTVALKVLRPAGSSAEAVSRFRREARLLGALQHPGIAQVYEAGSGTLVIRGAPVAEVPFIAMELVRGKPLTRACESAALPLAARLGLFLRVAEAVAYAHAQGVVHRDLKPGNILVAEVGTATRAGFELVPKVLDFGIARLVDPEGAAGPESTSTEPTLSTRTGQVLGTLAYMSPEQARGDGSAVDARADVWALGVLLYELTCGRRPFEVDGLALAAASRRIQEDDPTTLGQRDARLCGDVETIVGKALEKDPARRYANASELAADVRRHLAHEPIAARPPSATYLVTKFARRNKPLVVGSLAALAALVGGLSYGLVRARAERDEAQLATAFLADVLSAPDPMAGGRGITMVQAVRRWVPGLRARFESKPLLRGRLSVVLGSALVQDDPATSRELLTEAADLLARELGPNDAETLHARSFLAMLDGLEHNLASAETSLVGVISAQEDALGENAGATLLSRERLADTYVEEGRLEEAVKLYEAVIAAYDSATSETSNDETSGKAANAKVGLGRALLELGHGQEAEALLRPAVQRLTTLHGREHPMTLSASHTLSIVLSELGDPAKLAEAEQLTRDNLAIHERLLGPDASETLNARNTLAGILVERRDFDSARELLRDLSARSEKQNGADHPDTLATLNSLAQVELRSGHADSAEPLFADLCERTRRSMGPDHWYTWAFQTAHATALVDLNRAAEAEPLLLEAYPQCKRLLGEDDQRTKTAARQLVRVYTQLGRADAVQEWSAR